MLAPGSRLPSLQLACLLAVGASLPASARADCPAIPSAYSVPAACMSGGACAVSCAVGYIGTPSLAALTCDGTSWSPDPSALTGCSLVVCGAPASTTGYAVSAGCQHYQCSRTVACDAANGYVGIPATAYTACTAAGTWSPNPGTNSGCALAQCGPNPAPLGYTASCDRTFFGGTCAFGCDTASGYVGTPSASSSTCQLDQTWSVSAASLGGCAPAVCGVPSSAAGYTARCSSGHEFADTCAIACDAASGYVGAPVTSSITCGVGGTWSPDPSTNSGCTVANCGPSSPPVGYTASCNRTTFGGTCAYACDAASGYDGTPSASSATCQLDQTWSVSPASLAGCSLHDCGPLTLENADAADCRAHPRYGQGCTVSCLTGFLGSPTATCAMTGWEVSGACTVEPDGRGCAHPYLLAPGTPATFALDDQADALSTETCAGDLPAGKDVFLGAAVTTGDYRLVVDAGGASAVQVVVLDGCSPAACEPIALQGDGASFQGTVQAAADGTLLLAVHVLDAPAGGSASVTLDRAAEPPEGDSGGGCSTGAAATSLLALLAALAGLGARRRSR